MQKIEVIVRITKDQLPAPSSRRFLSGLKRTVLRQTP